MNLGLIRSVTLTLAVLEAIALSGCGDGAVEPEYVVDDPTVDLNKIGDPCERSEECRVGLKCEAGICEPAGSQVIGQSCVITAECVANAYCGLVWGCFGQSTYKPGTGCQTNDECENDHDPTVQCLPDPDGQQCQAEGKGEAGAGCSGDQDCRHGFFCRFTGFAGFCAEGGTGGLNALCEQSSECYPGLVCGPGDVCMSWLDAATAAKWDGEACQADEAENPRVYFEVPGEDGFPKNDFYRLPFPNDIRMGAGALTTGHPTPGRGFLDFDPIQRILDAANSGLDGFGTTPTVFFRFSKTLAFDTVDYTDDEATPANIRFVNIDQDSAAYKQPKGYVWGASDGRGLFLCQNWLTLRPHWGDPLEPETTYAAVLLKGMKAHDDGALFTADAHLQQLLSDTPSGLPLDAWTKYQPLRTWLKDEGISAADVIGAAVFTTGKPSRLMERARDVVRNQSPPQITDLMVCGTGEKSPCEDGVDPRRECGGSGVYWEVHGKIELPIFQTGTAPYLDPKDGGGIGVAGGGNPAVDHFEKVCFSLTIPKDQTMPDGGWPVVLYAHGTGGHFRSHAERGVSTMLSTIEGGGAAVLGIEAVGHGLRRGSSVLDAANLFFNFSNPAAARGNVYQGAFDYFSVVRWVESYAGSFGSVGAVDFDESKIGLLGHSQGATTAPLVAAYEPNLGSLVLSGAGAGLVESLLRKTQPVNIKAGVRAILGEEASVTHPVLSIMQQFFDPVDSINYGRLLTKTIPPEMTPKNILVVYGQGDSFTPPQTTRNLSDVLGLSVMAPALDTAPGQAFDGYLAGADDDPEKDRVVEGPIKNDFIINGVPVTLGMTHHAPDGDYDGHFVINNLAAARKQVAAFFGTWFHDDAAQIVIP